MVNLKTKPPVFWDYRPEPPHLASVCFLYYLSHIQHLQQNIYKSFVPFFRDRVSCLGRSWTPVISSPPLKCWYYRHITTNSGSFCPLILRVQIQLLQHHVFGIWIVLQMRAGFPDPAYFLSWFLSLPLTVCVTLDLLTILSFEFFIYEMGPVRIPYLRTYYENRKKICSMLHFRCLVQIPCVHS